MSLTVLILMILVGLALILLDLFFIPGGIVAFLGLGLIVYADYRSFQDLGNATGYWFVAISGICSGVLIWQFFRPSFWNRFGPEGEITGKMNTEDLEKVQIGDKGLSLGAIRPSGMARFGNDAVEVHTRDGIIPEQTPVEVVFIEDNRIYVTVIEN